MTPREWVCMLMAHFEVRAVLIGRHPPLSRSSPSAALEVLDRRLPGLVEADRGHRGHRAGTRQRAVDPEVHARALVVDRDLDEVIRPGHDLRGPLDHVKPCEEAVPAGSLGHP